MSANASGQRPIAIIGGTGPLGTGLALRWARAGETVVAKLAEIGVLS